MQQDGEGEENGGPGKGGQDDHLELMDPPCGQAPQEIATAPDNGRGQAGKDSDEVGGEHCSSWPLRRGPIRGAGAGQEPWREGIGAQAAGAASSCTLTPKNLLSIGPSSW